MSPLFETIALWLADVHLLGGALLALVLPVLLLLRQPVQRMAVAKSALAALAALVILCALPGWSLVYLLSAEAPDAPPALVVTTPVLNTPPRSVNQFIPHINIDQIPNEAPSAIAISTPVSPEPVRPSISWTMGLMLLQAVGSAAVIVWLAAGAIVVRRVRRASQPASIDLRQLLADLAGSGSAPTLLVSSAISTPVAFGVRRPAILLPANLVQLPALPGGSATIDVTQSARGGDDQRSATPGQSPGLSAPPSISAILAHEYAHVAAGDLRTLALARLLLAVFWAQPLFWLLRRRIRFDQESLADAAAAEVAGRLSYAEQLVGWAREVGPRGRAPRLAGAVGLWEGPSQLKRRIALLLDEKLTILRQASRRWRIGTACAALAAAALLSLVTVQRQEVVAADTTDAPGGSSGVAETSATVSSILPPILLEQATGPPLTITCLDAEGAPIPDVWLETYQFLHADSAGTFAKRAVSKTGSRGDHVFATDWVIAPISGMRSSDGNYSSAESTVLVIAHAKGLATAIRGFDAFDLQRKGAEVKVVMEPAVMLQGVVLDPDGRPAPGAIIRRHSVNGWPVSLDNIHNAKTGDDGRFVVDDLAPFAGKLTPDQQYIKGFVSGYVDDVDRHATLPFIVTHPEFAAPHLFVERVPDNLRITLEHPGELSGRIVYGSSDSTPATEIVVRVAMPREDPSVDPTAQTRFYEAETRTDADGRFQVRNLPSGEYVARVHYDGFGLTVPDHVLVTSNSSTAVPTIALPLINSIARFQMRDASGAPLSVARGTSAHIVAFAPDGPRPSVSGAKRLPISSAGTCSMRLPAGRYRFIVNVDLGKVDGQSQWLHTSDVTAEIVEGESSEVDVIFADAKVSASPASPAVPAPTATDVRGASGIPGGSDRASGEVVVHRVGDATPTTIVSNNALRATAPLQGSTTTGAAGILRTLEPLHGMGAGQTAVVQFVKPDDGVNAQNAAGQRLLVRHVGGEPFLMPSGGAIDPNASSPSRQRSVLDALGPASDAFRNSNLDDGVLSFVAAPAPDAGSDAAETTPNGGSSISGGATAAAAARPAEFPDWARHEPNVVKGRAVDPAGQPLVGVEVTLYRVVGWDGAVPEQLAVQTTGPDGNFKFENVFDVAKEFPQGLPDDRFVSSPIKILMVVGRAPGRATKWSNGAAYRVVREGYGVQLVMDRAAALTGRVTARDGRPIANAVVRFFQVLLPAGDSVNVTRTDADGRYAITDLAPYDAEATKRMREEQAKQDPNLASWTMVNVGMNVQVEHPDFATSSATIPRVPGTVDLELAPGSAIEGVVVIGDRTGVPLPAANVSVTLMRQTEPRITLAQLGFQPARTASVQTDGAGRYRFGSLAAGSYVMNAQSEGFVCHGVRDMKVGEGETTTAPEMTLTRGGTVRFKLVDANTNKPLALPDGTRGYVIPHPRPPLPSPRVVTFRNAVAETQMLAGRYGFIVNIPGATPTDPSWQSDKLPTTTLPEIKHDVKEGETVEVEVPVKLQDMERAATGTLQLYAPAAPSSGEDDEAAQEPKAPAAAATTPAANQGSSTGGVLDKLDPTRGAGRAEVILVPLEKWGYGLDGGSDNAPRR
jgi:beta-lactamase regulating signal transducer with metallopeptidase domain